MSVVESRSATLSMRRPERFALATALAALLLTLAALGSVAAGGGALFTYDVAIGGEAPDHRLGAAARDAACERDDRRAPGARVS